ncbi:MAG: PDZ domain-containing protein [Alphaproteobacteria bacterium]|nr:PDZ domain-containing protein [Alphaproteobacteria bacterium]
MTRARAVLIGALLLLGMGARAEPPCPEPGGWLAPAGAARPEWPAVAAELAAQRIVLVGETHDQVDHHRWQLHVLAALQGRRGDLVIGLEMIPRRVQPVLDRWVRGELDEAAFLRESDWANVWGFDFRLYQPLLEFARLSRVPLVALNVERSLIGATRARGWAAVGASEREGVGDPAPAPAAYRTMLADILRQHAGQRSAALADPAAADLDRFVEAQLVWDRAMAEALAKAADAPSRPLVAALVGSGHIQERHGIPHQLADLGIARGVSVLLPWAPGAACTGLGEKTADLVFGIVPEAGAAGPPRPRLGVQIGAGAGGVAVLAVTAGSVAEAATLQAGDLILTAAEVAVAAPRELVAIIQRQAPGTWLPLEVRRGETTLDLVARFPPAP